MTRLVARLVLAMLLLPVSGAVFLLLFFAMLRRNAPPPVMNLLAVWAILYALIATYWALLWRGMVRWTRARVATTLLATLGALGCGFAFGMVCLSINPRLPPQLAVLVGGGAAPIVWVLATVLLWRETAAERVARLSALQSGGVLCPLCGYNLAGLRDARCPECGGTFTLDQLFIAQQRA